MNSGQLDQTEVRATINMERTLTTCYSVSRRAIKLFGLLAVSFLVCPSISPAPAGEWRFSGVQRIVAVSDVHGAYNAMVSTFRSAGVIDERLAWSGAETHLVITGDLLDRGAESRRVVDLIMRLEEEATRAGGRVHLLLGNHEVMNLIGDTRYVADGEYAAFLDEESAEDRKMWFRQFQRGRKKRLDEDGFDEVAARNDFDEKAPPGFFGHRDAFRLGGHYANWLLEKPLLIVINDTAFVHGGLPSYVVEEGFDGVNRALKTDLIGYMNALSTLEEARVLSPIDQFHAHPAILTAAMNTGSLEWELSKAAEIAVDLKKSPLHGPEGPLWYRGNAVCSELIEGDLLDAALAKVEATRVVIGHTTTETRHVQQRLSGRVIEINTGMLKSSYRGSGYALIIEDGALSVVSEYGEADLSPVSPPRRVGDRPGALDDAALERVLADGAVLDSISISAERQLLRIKTGDGTVLAYFDTLPAERGFAPELAAYRLDRMLGLDMIPVTVRREVFGRHGTLQLASVDALTELDRVAEQNRRRGRCPIDRQLSAMYTFDALINNPARTPQTMLYADDDWQLMLVDHRESFGAANGPGMELASAGPKVGDTWRKKLAEMDDHVLRDSLHDVLRGHQLTALAERRDILIGEKGRYPGR